jgi:hypothetical protein
MKRHLAIGLVAALTLLLSGAAFGKELEEFRGFGVHLQGKGRGTIIIGIERWSTDEERNNYLTILRDKGQAALIKALEDGPRVGYIRLANSQAVELKYARSTELPDGTRRVVIATNRFIHFKEAATPTRSRYYDFSIAEIRFPKGEEKGEGKLAPATAISVDKTTNALSIENYGVEPVRMSSITSKKP